MQLVEAGKVELDAPVQRYIPWFRVADEAASAQITVRHLLNHTSGLSTKTGRSFQGNGDTSDSALERAVRKLSTAQLTAPVGRDSPIQHDQLLGAGADRADRERTVLRALHPGAHLRPAEDAPFLHLRGRRRATGSGHRPPLLVRPAGSRRRAVQPRPPPRRLPHLQRGGHGSLPDRPTQRRPLRRCRSPLAVRDGRTAPTRRSHT